MKNLAIGFVVGYLVCTFIIGGPGAVGTVVTDSVVQLSVWWDQAVATFNESNG
jgi:hypothetical protein|tara:strand:+ start:6236 stop:6394 length:159 start_codon:yes stop_codon:yes gene_type:complete